MFKNVYLIILFLDVFGKYSNYWTHTNREQICTSRQRAFGKKPRLLSLEECSTSSTCSINSTSSIASTSYFTNETLEAPVIIEKKTENVIILKTYDVINFDVKSLLKNHIIGRAILLKYEKAKCIDNKDRNHLCDIIVCHFLNEGKQLNNATISILAEKIVEIFPEEKNPHIMLVLLEKENHVTINQK